MATTSILKATTDLLASAQQLQSDLRNSKAAAAVAKKNTAFFGNALRAMDTIVLKLNAQNEEEAAAAAVAADLAAQAAVLQAQQAAIAAEATEANDATAK
jgi:hypothetical protein